LIDLEIADNERAALSPDDCQNSIEIKRDSNKQEKESNAQFGSVLILLLKHRLAQLERQSKATHCKQCDSMTQ
jgi:hypothetical protein